MKTKTGKEINIINNEEENNSPIIDDENQNNNHNDKHIKEKKNKDREIR